ncbi:hypothetical protein AC578_7111 [Pseudocercospora eumusae]|uniref:Uncharacterized protein n=1 Tax=Pseudocercospora eumusae TaxID=321146 RepID=A0A139HWG9_9PEZI|nr:hypothetical protein AC578_7111 [Pseudocercospora eumusae]
MEIELHRLDEESSHKADDVHAARMSLSPCVPSRFNHLITQRTESCHISSLSPASYLPRVATYQHTFHSRPRQPGTLQKTWSYSPHHFSHTCTSAFLPITSPAKKNMHRTAAIILLAAATASAQTATITIEASHGGAGSGLTNNTIQVPLNTRYTNPALDTVSTLYLTASDGVPLDSITCTPYRNNNLTGAGGLPFTSSKPSFLSTNTVQVGSILCNSTSGTTTTSTAASVTSTVSATSNLSTTSNASIVPTTTTARNLTSVYLTTVSPTRPGPSTVTSIFTGSEGPTTSTLTSVVEGGSPTSSASPSLNSESAADENKVQKWLAQGMAVFGAALVAAL